MLIRAASATYPSLDASQNQTDAWTEAPRVASRGIHVWRLPLATTPCDMYACWSKSLSEKRTPALSTSVGATLQSLHSSSRPRHHPCALHSACLHELGLALGSVAEASAY